MEIDPTTQIGADGLRHPAGTQPTNSDVYNPQPPVSRADLTELSVELPLTLEADGEVRARGVERLIHSFTPGSAIVNTADETSLLSATFDTAASELAEGDLLRFLWWGTVMNDSSANRTTIFRTKADGLGLGSAQLNAYIDANVLNRHWRYEMVVVVGATGTAPRSTGLLTLRASLGGAHDEAQQTHSASGNVLNLAQPITWDFTVDHDVADPNLSAVLIGGLMWHTRV